MNDKPKAQYIRCPVCGKVNALWFNSRGHLQMYCKDCRTALFLNGVASVQILLHNHKIFERKEDAQQLA